MATMLLMFGGLIEGECDGIEKMSDVERRCWKSLLDAVEMRVLMMRMRFNFKRALGQVI